MTEAIKQGKTTKKLGISLFVAGLILSVVFRFIPDSEMNEVLIIISFIPMLLIPSGIFFIWRGKQYAAIEVAEKVLYDSKLDVLYLRSFDSDASIRGTVIGSMFLNPAVYAGHLATEEEQLRDALQPFGDLVAIGKPGESLPTPGAARQYATDDEWKGIVTDKMKKAPLVVIRAGSSEGLQWELGEAIRILDPKKLLILIHSMNKKEYQNFKQLADQIFEVKLPTFEEIKRFGKVSGFLHFSDKWKPVFLRLRLPFFRFGSKAQRRLFTYTLRPIFEKFGLEWQAPKISIPYIFSLLFFLCIAIGFIFFILILLFEH